jgi:3-dehydroquinate synthetase
VAVIDRRLLRAAPGLVAQIPARACLPVVAGERAKRLRRLEPILEWLAEQRVERDTPLLAVGGGTIGDLAGTAAALFARGLPLVQVPTTWLAQADSAIGGKVAVDLAAAKNAVGAFWPPVAVVADVAALRSLPLRLRRDGMAESVKAALIGDAALWRLLEERGRKALRADEPARFAIVERSARLKLGVCDRDPFEAGERRMLNLGHTIGHALEIESRYRLPHGSAVALGLRAVAAIAAARSGDAGLARRLDALLADLGFGLTRAFDPARVRDAMLGDKKRRDGHQRWILPMEIGRVVEVDDVTDAELGRALRAIGA